MNGPAVSGEEWGPGSNALPLPLTFFASFARPKGSVNYSVVLQLPLDLWTQ